MGDRYDENARTLIRLHVPHIDAEDARIFAHNLACNLRSAHARGAGEEREREEPSCIEPECGEPAAYCEKHYDERGQNCEYGGWITAAQQGAIDEHSKRLVQERDAARAEVAGMVDRARTVDGEHKRAVRELRAEVERLTEDHARLQTKLDAAQGALRDTMRDATDNAATADRYREALEKIGYSADNGLRDIARKALEGKT